MILFLGKEEFLCNFLGAKEQRYKVTKVYIEDAQYIVRLFFFFESINLSFRIKAPGELNIGRKEIVSR